MATLRNVLSRTHVRLIVRSYGCPRVPPNYLDQASSSGLWWRYQSTSLATSSKSQPSSDDKSDLIISDRAVQRLKNIASSGECLRVLVESGGCSGFEYKFELVNGPEQDDRIFEKDGARVIVDQVSLDFLKGATIDYQVELIKAAFRIMQNPLAEKGCSCGASFALKMPGDIEKGKR